MEARGESLGPLSFGCREFGSQGPIYTCRWLDLLLLARMVPVSALCN